MSDLELLRRHEPVLRFTEGELFFPCAVDGYVKECDLIMRDRGGRTRTVVPRGALDLDRLAEDDEGAPGFSLSLRFVDEPLPPLEFQQWRRRPDRPPFYAPGRLARVSPWSRILDSAFDLSLFVRGRVPGGTTAAAEVKYTQLRARDDRRVYYGRVVRAGGWTVLQYWFFYVMNDWRSTFYGANDHEADWEQVLVYLYEDDRGELEPRWVAFASHDYTGDDLRRRWDDPLLSKEGPHPVVFTAAGSHSSYCEQGEYVMSVEPRFLTPVKRASGAVRRFWSEKLGQGDPARVDRTITALISVPFVDYARGDGLTIGPNGDSEWSPVLISEDVPWVSQYRGLWGLDTRDPFGGERAPAGPKYNRDGSVRLSWYDPLGFAGLDKVEPPSRLEPTLERRTAELATELEELDRRIEEKGRGVRDLALEDEALRAGAADSPAHGQTFIELTKADDELRSLKGRRNRLQQIREAVRRYSERVSAGWSNDPDSHLSKVRRPDPPPNARGALRVWAALSGGVALLAVVALLTVFPSHRWLWALVLGLGFAIVEATAEGRLLKLLLSITVVLAVITALILMKEHWRLLVVGTLGVVIAIMVRDNLRELMRSRRPP